MQIEAQKVLNGDMSAIIDVTMYYDPRDEQTYRVHIDKVTERFTVFKDGITRSTVHDIQDANDLVELEELAILVCIQFPEGE